MSLPAPSAFCLAAARLGWALQEIETVSLHGRPLDLIRPLLHPGRAHPGADLGRRRRRRRSPRCLTERGFGASRLTVLEALGGPDERVRHGPRRRASTSTDINPLNVLAHRS